MRRFLCAIAALLLPLTVAGCDRDPFQQPGTWSLPPAGLDANDANLRTMLVNPNDIVAGTGPEDSLAPLATRPIDLLVTGRRKALPSVNASDIGTSGGGQPQGGQGQQGSGGGQETQ
jgi:hypothetical protein